MTASCLPRHRSQRWLCDRVCTMTPSVGIRELRRNVGTILKRVSDGEVVEVTDHVHPIARIVPLRSVALDELVSEGRAPDPDGDLLELMDKLGLPAPAERGKRRPTTALAELRATELESGVSSLRQTFIRRRQRATRAVALG